MGRKGIKSDLLKNQTVYTKYLPHGISNDIKPLSDDDENLNIFKKYYGLDEYDFVVLWNNRNIRRKQPGDVILAFSEFAKRHTDKKVCLFIHSQKVDANGTDIPEVIKWNGKYGDYKFTDRQFTPIELNLYYNSGDLLLSIASNEGFGLASCEALKAGTPILVNVTGGLQDQCGFFLEDEKRYLNEEDYVTLGSLHDIENLPDDLTWQDWVYPVWPTNRSLQGSPQTPYIFDDRCYYKDVADGLTRMMERGRDRLKIDGMKGVEFVNTIGKMNVTDLGNSFIEAVDMLFDNWKPRNKVELVKL